MGKRVITAIVGLPILFGVLYLGNYFLFVGCILLSSIALIEYTHAMDKLLDEEINLFFILILGFCVTLSMKFDYYSLMGTMIIIFFIVFMYEILTQKGNINRGIYTFFGLCYIPVMFGFLMLFENLNKGLYFMWMVFIITFATDTAAYFVGIRFGKRKLSPTISPNKTIAGAIGGMLAAGFLNMLYGLILRQFFGAAIPLFFFIVVGIVGSIVAQCGDLTASMVKRKTGIKDFGKILPGHGGILDRFDSLLFTIPLVYLFASYTVGIA